MPLKYEFSPDLPIYLQIIEEIKRQIISGERKPGDRVESVRDIAQFMGVNPNTMQKALSELEKQGLIYTERTAGRFITMDKSIISETKLYLAKNKIAEFVEFMYKLGFSKSEIIKLVEKLMEENHNG